jgi:hypothetical protein
MFKFKDLFVSVTSPSQNTLNLCAIPTPNPYKLAAVASTPCCGGASFPFRGIVISFPIGDPDFGIGQFGGLENIGEFAGSVSLKDYLKAALEREEARENAQAERQLPRTLAEAEMLELKLVEALEELRTRKAELKQDAA